MSSKKDRRKKTNNDDSIQDFTLSSSGLDLGLDALTGGDGVDELGNFDLDFDAMAGQLGASLPDITSLPDINLENMYKLTGGTGGGSLGTRSPSIGSKQSEYSKGSKRSRAEFDNNDDYNSDAESSYASKQQRMLFHTDMGLGGGVFNEDGVGVGGGSPNKILRQGRERDGRCPDCGLDTHRVVMTDNSFELEPLTIEGEVLNGQCLLCNPDAMFESGSGDNLSISGSSLEKKSSSKKKGSSRKKGESSTSSSATKKKKEKSGKKKSSSSGSSSRRGSAHDPQQHQQQQQNFTFSAPPGRSPSSGGINKHSPTPNSYHSKMALMKQAQLPRAHSAMQHARLAFGDTNNNRPPSLPGGGVGVGDNMNKLGRKPSSGARRSSSGAGRHSSNNSLSSVSCSENMESSGGHNNRPMNRHSSNGEGGDDNHSRISSQQHSQSNKDMGIPNTMSGMCTETAAAMAPAPPPPPQRAMSTGGGGAQSPHPLTPQAPMRRLGSSASQQTPQSAPVNMSNMMSGGRMDTSSSNSLPDILGKPSPAVKLAHSKLQSSIYHHHIFPMNDETERSQGEKTLMYLESGSGDICDIIVAMRRFPFSLAIQRVACEKLYAHCFDQEHASAIGLVGGIRTIIDAMEHHPDDVALQRGCAGVIKHLATASPYNLKMLDRMGTVAIVVSTMERHPQNAQLLESCCWAMESMARTQMPELKMRVAKGGGIQAAMKAVETFPNNESLLRAAFHCLRQLGYNPSSYNSHLGGPPGQQQQQQQQLTPQQMQMQQQMFQQRQGSRGSGGSGRGGGGMMMSPNNNMMGSPMNNNNNQMMGNANMMGNSNR